MYGVTMGSNAYLIVFLGAGIGGMLRHGVNALASRLVGPDLPVGTFSVNVIGSLIVGVIAGFMAFKGHVDQSWRLFTVTGLLGGFTTFSAFSLETALLWERGQLVAAAAYVGVSVVLSVGAVFVGLAAARAGL